MAPASSSLVPAGTSNDGAKRPFAADASDDAELPHPQESAVTKKNGQNQHQPQQKLECPRCSSSDTKFCYYNNYSTAQPRHFCRTCRRYWTHGGTLRTVPVGGACRRRGSGSGKRSRHSAEPRTTSSDSPPQPDLQDARPLPAFPFLTDGLVFLPQFDLGLSGFPWTTTPPATDHLYDGFAAPWGGCDGAWDDFNGLELTWPPPPPPAGN